MADMDLEKFVNISLFFTLALFTTTAFGAKIKSDVTHLEDTKLRVPGVIPQSLTIENLSLDNNRKNKPTREPPSSSAVLTTTTTNGPPPPVSSISLYQLIGENNIACILIQTDGLLEFHYTGKVGDKVESDVYLPDRDDQITGSCDSDDTAYIKVPWKDFTWTVHFSKTPGAERWFVRQMEVAADASNKAFEHINRPPNTILRFVNNTMLFPTPVGHSFSCSLETIIELKDKDAQALLYLRNLRIQPFIFKKSEFGPEYVCLPGSKSFRDETAPIAVGSTLAIVTLLTVTGYGVYRYMKVKKVQYDTME